ncbi:MAG: hypothetical protein AAB604_02265 [Patescibacteria group bacterium]
MEKYIGFLVIILMGAVIVAVATNVSFFGAPHENPPGPGGFSFFSFPDKAYTPTPSPSKPLFPSLSSGGGTTQESPPDKGGAGGLSAPSTETIRKALTLRRANATRTGPQEEYLDLQYRSSFFRKDELSSLDLTDWTVENTRGDRFSFGYVANLPYAGEVNQLARFIVPSDSTIHVITGKSPFSASFRTNTCTGYFAQFDSYTPSIDQQCPRPSDEPAQGSLNDACLDYIESLPSCRIPQNTLLDIGNTCRVYITNNINYRGCVANHKIDADFYRNEWYVYLGRPTELWKEKREHIILRDGQGTLMAELEY